jgi:O-antigen/teichoic acid export membrane protein
MKEYRDLERVTYLILISIGTGCFIVSLMAPEIINILATKDYIEGIYVVPPVALGVFFTVLFNIFANIEFLYKRNFLIMLMTLLAAILNITLNVLLIPKLGFIIAGYTTAFSYMVYALLHYLNMLKLHKERIFNNTKLLVICMVVTMLCITCIFLYKYSFIRYLICFVVLIIILLNKSRIKRMLK